MSEEKLAAINNLLSQSTQEFSKIHYLLYKALASHEEAKRLQLMALTKILELRSFEDTNVSLPPLR